MKEQKDFRMFELPNYVRCKICTYVEGKEKFLVLKLDTLLKHASHKNAKYPCLGLVSMPRIDVGS
jgi:hypothetical protein